MYTRPTNLPTQNSEPPDRPCSPGGQSRAGRRRRRTRRRTRRAQGEDEEEGATGGSFCAPRPHEPAARGLLTAWERRNLGGERGVGVACWAVSGEEQKPCPAKKTGPNRISV